MDDMGGFLPWWVSPTTMGFFLLKMISTWDVFWGVPPFKETPICLLSKPRNWKTYRRGAEDFGPLNAESTWSFPVLRSYIYIGDLRRISIHEPKQDIHIVASDVSKSKVDMKAKICWVNHMWLSTYQPIHPKDPEKRDVETPNWGKIPTQNFPKKL